MAATDANFDCRSCGACCRGAVDGRVLVAEYDLVRFRRAGRGDLELSLVPGHFGLAGLPSTREGACLHQGLPGQANDCSIYDIRPDACRSLEPGSSQCRSYRRDAGLEDPE